MAACQVNVSEQQELEVWNRIDYSSGGKELLPCKPIKSFYQGRRGGRHGKGAKEMKKREKTERRQTARCSKLVISH